VNNLSADVKRKYSIIAAITNHSAPKLLDIAQVTGIPLSSVKRQLAQLRTDFAMDIRFIPDPTQKGRTGHYYIYEWGVIDRTKFLLKYGSILENR